MQKPMMTITMQRPQDEAPMTIAPPEGSTGWTMVSATGYVAGQANHGLPRGTRILIELAFDEAPIAGVLAL